MTTFISLFLSLSIAILLVSHPPIYSIFARNETSSVEWIKYFEENWKSNQRLLSSLDAYKLLPRLNMYSKLDKDIIDHYQHVNNEVMLQIAWNESARNHLEQMRAAPAQINRLALDGLELRIALSFHRSLLKRKQHHFKEALDEIILSFSLIEECGRLCTLFNIKPFKAQKEMLALAHYHKAKIHRMLAGYDLDNLDAHELNLCKANYLAALAIAKDNPAIMSSLGFLYNDMNNHEEAFYYHLQANIANPSTPEYVHGLAVAYYHLEHQKFLKNTPFDPANIQKSEEAFEQALVLFKEFNTENSRIFLDFGKLKLLLGKRQEALIEFNNGLRIEPHHPLLLMERGSLLANLGHAEAGLRDLYLGKVSHREKDLLHGKYHAAINTLTKHKDAASSAIPKKALDSILDKSANYARALGKKPKTCFISYAWSIREHELWVEDLAVNLERAGFLVLLDRWFTRKGHETMDFVEKIMANETDYILVIGTKKYLQKYLHHAQQMHEREYVVRAEARLLNYLIGFNQKKSNRIIPLLIEGSIEQSLPPMMRPKNIVDFTIGDYQNTILELIRDMYEIDQRDAFFKTLMNSNKTRG